MRCGTDWNCWAASPGGQTILRDPRLSPRMEEILELEAKGWAVKRIADHFKVGDSSIYTQTQAAVHRLEVAYRPALTGRGSGCKDYTYQLRRFSDKQALIHEINFDPQPEAT